MTPAEIGSPALTERVEIAITRTPARVAAPSNMEAPQAVARLCPLANITEAMVNPSGTLCRKTARKIIQPNHTEIMKPEAMAMPSKKVWITNPSSTE